MYTLPRYPYPQRSPLLKVRNYGEPVIRAKRERALRHKRRIYRDLRYLGLSRLALGSSESRYLSRIIHEDERLGGVVFGLHSDGLVMLIATDRRVIFLDKKPLFTNEDEVNYYVISGVNIGEAGFGSTVTLHTRIKDYVIRTYNPKAAHIFVEYIEARCLEHQQAGFAYDLMDPQSSNTANPV